MKEEKLLELGNTWLTLVLNKEKMGRTILELVAHPDATPEQLSEALPRYKEVVGNLRKHRPVILEALDKGYSWRVQSLKDKVRNTKL